MNSEKIKKILFVFKIFLSVFVFIYIMELILNRKFVFAFFIQLCIVNICVSVQFILNSNSV